MDNYNWLVQTVNDEFHTTFKDSKVAMFGRNFNTINFISDLVIVIIIILVVLMVFLKIYWSEKDNEKRPL
jgi:hypothetical protein